MSLKTLSNPRNAWPSPAANQAGLDQVHPSQTYSGLMQTGQDLPLPLGFPEMLDGNDYHVALVSKSLRDRQQESRVTASGPLRAGIVLEFSWRELVSRVAEYVRKSERIQVSRVSSFSDVSVDFAKLEVTRGSGQSIPMTNQEFKMLHCFLLNPGRVFSRDELLDHAWGYENYPVTRTVDNHVLKLRKKLEPDPCHPVHFQTIHGVGYKFVP